MFKQAFRLTFVTFVWKKYKRAIVSTALLFGYLWLVGYFHDQYIAKATLEGNPEVGSSFLVKWAAQLIGVGIFFIYHLIKRERPNKPADQQKLAEYDDENDPFAEIRNKKHLRSKVEVMMEEKSKD